MLTFALMSLQIRCTGTAYGDIRTKSAAQAPHMLTFARNPLHRHRMLTFASMSLQIRCTSTAYAHFRCNFVVNPPSLRTETPSAAVWAKPSWIIMGWLCCTHLLQVELLKVTLPDDILHLLLGHLHIVLDLPSLSWSNGIDISSDRIS